MPLTIMFQDPCATLEEVSRLQRKGRIHLRENATVQPNGRPAFFLGYACLPDFLFQAPDLPAELDPLYIYRDELQDGGAATQGEYTVEGIEHMNVQRKKDHQKNVFFSRVVIIGKDLQKISDTIEKLRVGDLLPNKAYSSPGLIAAPVNTSANDTKEDSGQLILPLSAAPVTKAA